MTNKPYLIRLNLAFAFFARSISKNKVIDEYALQAFKLNGIDYLLKPIDDEKLEVAVKKLLINPLNMNTKKRFTVRGRAAS